MCGITGIFAPGRDAARLAYFGLYALQHRGQESAGIAAGDGGTMRSHKDMGLIGAIFDEQSLALLSAHVAVGHTRYSTTGSSMVVNAQPLLETHRDRRLRVRAQRQSDQHRRSARGASAEHDAAGDLRLRGDGQDDRRGAGLDARSHQARARGRARRLLDRARDQRRALRVPRSVGRAAALHRHLSRRRLRRSRPNRARCRRSVQRICARSKRARSCGSARRASNRSSSRTSARIQRCACSSTSTSRAPIRRSTAVRSTWRATRWVARSRRSIRSMRTS